MKPKGATEHDEGLLEYLEDIIGTSKSVLSLVSAWNRKVADKIANSNRYKAEIELAVVEVDRLNDARGVQMNRVKLVEREKSALEVRFIFPILFDVT